MITSLKEEIKMVFDFTKDQPQKQQDEVSFKKTEELAVLSRNAKGWTVELNKISYNGRDPVYDLRSWSPQGRIGKGLTLTDQTLNNLLIVLKAHLEGELPSEEQNTAIEGQEIDGEQGINAHLPEF